MDKWQKEAEELFQAWLKAKEGNNKDSHLERFTADIAYIDYLCEELRKTRTKLEVLKDVVSDW